MDSQNNHFHFFSNDSPTKWLYRIEFSLSLDVTWGVSQDELAETENENEE